MRSIHDILTNDFKKFMVQKGGPVIQNLSTDSRNIKKGDAFLALSGERFDGHDFIGEAIKKDISALIVKQSYINTEIPKDITIFAVKDTLETYQQIAKKYLESIPAKKIAVTGTSGKTTVKEMIKAFLSEKFKVFANRGNLNNQIGVPLSALEVKNEDICIFEMGAGEPGDIKRLSSIVMPDIAVVTSVGEGHLEFFETTKGVAKEKSSVLEFAKSGYCPENILHPNYFKKFKKIALNVFTRYKAENNGFFIEMQGQYLFLPFWGIHNLYNFAVASSIALEMGVSMRQIINGLKNIQIPSYRQEKRTKNGIDFYLDCYNANPLSMRMSLEGFTHLKGEKIVVLGDMLELGKDSEKLHQQIGEYLNTLEGFKKVIFYGPQMKFAFKAYKNANRYYSDNKFEIIEELKQSAQTGNCVLLKASRGIKLEEIFEGF